MTFPAWISSLRKKDQPRVRKYVAFLTHASRMFVDPYLAHVVRYAPSKRYDIVEGVAKQYQDSQYLYASQKPAEATRGYAYQLLDGIVRHDDVTDLYDDISTNLRQATRGDLRE